MDFSNFWWQAAEAPAPPGGIGNSLRFKGQQYLNRVPTISTTGPYTMSMWFKRSKLGVNYQYLYNAYQYDSRPQGDLIWFRNTDRFSVQKQGGSGYASPTTVYRDPSAWYHIVWVLTAENSGDNFQVYMNGQRIPTDGGRW